MQKNSIIRNIFGVFLVCMVLTGCGCAMADRAVSVPVGNSISISEESVSKELVSKEPVPKELVPFGQSDAAASDGEETYIYVHVCGAVASPGVLKLPAGSRGADALAMAGGFAEDAMEDYINLAARLEDGQKLYFPTREEAALLQEESRQEESALVNINTADESRLCTLPGIGESRAKEIIAYRKLHGSFKKTEDIMQVSGIKESVYQKISDRITVD